MNATAEEIDRYLATAMGWTFHTTADGSPVWTDSERRFMFDRDWHPSHDRDQLAEVLAKVPEHLRDEITAEIVSAGVGAMTQADCWTLLTADPLTVCRAIYQALNNKQETRDDE